VAFKEEMLNVLRIAVGVVLLAAAAAGTAALRRRLPTGALMPADQVRLAILKSAISQTVHSDLLVCLGIVEKESGARPRNPSHELLTVLRSAARITPLTDCVDIDEDNGQRRGTLLIEAYPLEWNDDKAAKMTVYASSDKLVGTTIWGAQLTADGSWEVGVQPVDRNSPKE
jgi:hypothetical protein